MNKIQKILQDPYHVFFWLKKIGFLEILPDTPYVKFMYRAYMGKRLDLKNPSSLNEKLQWLKLYYHDPRYTNLVDKFEAKRYVADLIGGVYHTNSRGLEFV